MTKEQYDMLRQKGGYDAMYIDLLNASGFAGVLSNGNIVDRRYHPEAIPIQKNSVFGVVDPKQPTALDLIAQERERHETVEGWTKQGDQQHVNGELARAAAAYAIPYEYDSARRNVTQKANRCTKETAKDLSEIPRPLRLLWKGD